MSSNKKQALLREASHQVIAGGSAGRLCHKAEVQELVNHLCDNSQVGYSVYRAADTVESVVASGIA